MEQRPPEVAIFGGSFDPPHCAHVMVVSWVLTCTPCEQVLVVPVAEHPFGKRSAPFQVRLSMARAAFACFGDRVTVSDIEARLPQPSYTVQTLRALRQTFPTARFTLVVGSDIPKETGRWQSFDEVQRLARLMVVARAGADQGGQGPVFPDVSSTELRAALAAGKDCTAFIPRDVLAMIFKEGLYGTR